jgi:hypothetical protein
VSAHGGPYRGLKRPWRTRAKLPQRQNPRATPLGIGLGYRNNHEPGTPLAGAPGSWLVRLPGPDGGAVSAEEGARLSGRSSGHGRAVLISRDQLMRVPEAPLTTESSISSDQLPLGLSDMKSVANSSRPEPD